MMVKTFLFFSLGALLLHLPAGTQAWRILISAPTGTKSYHNMFVSLATEMSHRGHHVTVISNYKSSDLEKAVNVRQITLEKLAFNMSKYPNQFEANVSPAVMLKGIQSFINAFRELPIKITETLYSDQNVKELIANESFDLVMVSISFNSASYSLGWHFNAPVIMLTPNSIFPGVVDALGDNDHPEYVPFFLGSFTDRMSLFQRTINTVATYFYSYFAHKYHQSACLSYIRQTIMPESPSLQDLERNILLIFTNSHPAINYPRALPPQIIEVGGIHCRPARPLPQDLETFVSHPDGFILFAIGSTLPMEIMPDYLMEAFIQTFAQLPQRVIWQWKGKIRANLPENILALSWLPQQDLLGNEVFIVAFIIEILLFVLYRTQELQTFHNARWFKQHSRSGLSRYPSLGSASWNRSKIEHTTCG